jgi:lysophospholipase L1-like esterase
MQKIILIFRLMFLSLLGLLPLLAVTFAVAQHPMRIMALGDSITAGYTDNPTFNVPFGFGFRSGLYSRLTNANYPFQFVGGSQEPFNGASGLPKTVSAPDLRTVNENFHRGYGGWNADSLNGYIPYWLNSDNPDVVLLMIGINSIGSGSSGNPTGAENSLNTLVQSIFNTRPNISVVVAQITPYSSYTNSIVQYNDYIKNTLVPNFSNQGKKISTVDQYSNFLKNGSIDATLYSNGINHPNATGYDRMAQTWFSGIQALGTITTAPTPAQAVLENGGFETAYFTAKSHNINPSGASWTFSPSIVSGSGSGIDQGDPYSSGNGTPASGAQMGYLQGLGSGNGTSQIAQSMTGLVVGKIYSISFQAKGIDHFSGANPFSVSLDGTNLKFGGSTLLSPAVAASYTSYNTTFTATSSTMNLRFYDAGNVVTGKVSWIDNVKLGIVTPASENLVVNGSFEATSYANNTHNINPSGTSWRFTPSTAGAGSGIDRGNPYGATDAPNGASFDGSQYAFLQGSGTGNGVTGIEQDVAGFQIGKSYRLSFESASLEGASGANPFSASIDGTPVTFNGRTTVSPSASYGLYISDPFIATGSTMTLRFFDAGNVSTRQASWLDDVQITIVPEPSTAINFLSLAGFGILGFFWRCHRKARCQWHA